MKLGIISDVHGNTTGLKCCLNYFSQIDIDQVVFLGDVVGYFPNPFEAITMLKQQEVHCLLGNHDAMLLGMIPLDKKKDEVYQIGKLKESLPAELKQYISTWLPWYEMEIGDKKLLFVHGSPFNPLSGYIYSDSDISCFKDLAYDAIFMGHTHRPFVKRITGNKLIANVGSCGLPRDQGDLAACAIYDVDKHLCEIHRLRLDVKSLLNHYEDDLHESVVKCLQRRNENIFGDIVDVKFR